MSFANSKTTRNIFPVTQFNPPPGHYTQMSAPQFISDTSNFSKQQRFHNQIEKLINTPGPGQYFKRKPEKQDDAMKDKLRSKKGNNIIFKIGGMPSIPSKDNSLDDLGAGIILMKASERPRDVKIGPGAYDANYNIIKPKVKGFSITEGNTKSRKKRVKSTEYISGLEQIKTDKQSPNKSNQKIHELDEDFTSNNQQKFSNTVTSAGKTRTKKIFRETLMKKFELNKKTNAEYNLELLLLREKNVSKQQIPPPGAYYDEFQFSSFKPKPIKNKYQNAFGTTDRIIFSDGESLLKPSPGQYQINPITEKKSAYISQLPRSDIQPVLDLDQGPGSYEIAKNIIQKLKPNKAQYQGVFGSGAKRFLEKNPESLPGPGEYESIPKRKQKNRSKTKYMHLNNIFDEDNEFEDSQSQTKQFKSLAFGKRSPKENPPLSLMGNQQVEVQSNEKPVKFQKPTSSFASNVIRLADNINESALGPGLYQIDEIPTKKNFNVNSVVVPREKRVLSLNLNSTSKRVGPGAYDYDVNCIKQKKMANLNFK